MQACEYCLEIENLTVAYGKRVALENVNLHLSKGEFHAVVGPNGGGKTTLVKAILGLIRTLSGNIMIFGKPQKEYLKENTIGYLPQTHSTNISKVPLKVIDVVLMGCVGYRGLTGYRKDVIKRVEKIMDMLEVLDRCNSLFDNLSGGLKQRVLIARALVSNPELLIMDEPTVGLDVKAQKDFYSLIKKLREQLNITIIMVSHDVGFVFEYADTVVCVNKRVHLHTKHEDKLSKDFFNRLYGYDVKFVDHRHGDRDV